MDKKKVMGLSDGNAGSIAVILELTKLTNQSPCYVFEKLDIKCSSIYKLFSDCSNKDLHKLNRTLKMLECNVFPIKDVYCNLELQHAISFIDDTIKIECVPPYENIFGPQDENWTEYCEANRKSFISRINEISKGKTFCKK